MSDVIDFFEIGENNQAIKDDLKERADVIAAGLRDVKSLPNDLYNLPLSALSDEQAKSEVIESKYADLIFAHMAKYGLASIDVHNSLALLCKLQDISSGYGADIAKTEDILVNIDGIAHHVFSFLDQNNISITEENSKITQFCVENESLITPDMGSADINKLYGEIYSHVCESLNQLAVLDIKSLDIELGYLHYCDNLPQGIADIKSQLMDGVIGRVEYLLSASNSYLGSVQAVHGHHLSTESPASDHGLH